jgi:hypothetical protein
MDTIKLDTRELDRIAKGLDTGREAIGRRIAFQIESEAKQNAPVDTSALRNSIYTLTTKDDGYGGASAVAESARPGIETEPHPALNGDELARVGPCVEYAYWVEFGRNKRPYFVRAVESVTSRLNTGEMAEDLGLT